MRTLTKTVVSLVALAAAALASADFAASASANVLSHGLGGYKADDAGHPDAQAHVASAYGSAEAYAYGNYLSMHTFAHAFGDNPDYVGISASVTATDTLNVSAAGFEGQEGFVTMAVRLGGTTLGSGYARGSVPGYPYFNASNIVWIGNAVFDQQYFASPSYPGGEYSPFPEIQEVDIPVTFGQASTFRASVTSEAGMVSASGDLTADFSHTFEWKGVKGVKDANGAAISSYSLKSGSGTDYVNLVSAPVPEPGSIMALGVGTAGLLRRRLRRSA